MPTLSGEIWMLGRRKREYKRDIRAVRVRENESEEWTGKKTEIGRETATERGSCPDPARPISRLQKDQRRARLPPSIPPVDDSRLVRDDRARRLTHTHWGYNSNRQHLGVCLRVLLRASSLSAKHTYTHTRAQSSLKNTNHAEETGDNYPNHSSWNQFSKRSNERRTKSE